MSTPALRKSSSDDRYELSIITKATLPGALSVIQQAFFVDENVSIATRVAENAQAIEELSELCVRAANDGVSIIAHEKQTGKPVSAFFNKLQVCVAENEDNYFEQFEARCKHSSSRGLMRYMIEMEKMYDVFAEMQVSCALEIMFIGTLRENRMHSLGTQMWDFTLDIARRLRSGENIKVSPKGLPLPLTPIPECVVALATSNATSRIAEKFDFQLLLDVPFDRFSFEGISFAERIGPDTKSSKLVYKDLR